MNTLITAIGLTLLHFVWEGALIALPLALFPASSRTRYRIACAALFAMPIAFAVTLAMVLPPHFEKLPIAAIPSVAAGLLSPASPALQEPLLARLAGAARWFVPFWLAGVCLFYLRGFGGWIAVQRIRRGASADVPRWCVQSMNRIAGSMGLNRAVRLLESCQVDAPVVIGFLRPAILFPAGLLTGLPVGQLECLLIHELSHIRRSDYVVNLLQTVVEGLLFYHPAVWWVSGVLRTERENCCDDTVVAMNSDAGGYAATLAALEQNRWAAAQAASGGDLLNRVQRMLTGGAPRRVTATPLALTALLTLSGIIVLMSSPGPLRPLMAQALSSPDSVLRHWLTEDVAYIISDDERAAFRNLTTDQEREHFVEQFWLRRDPTPGTIQNEYKEEHYRRIAYVNQHFASAVPGWKTDRGRIYIVYGPPDEIDSHPACAAGTGAYVDWQYRYIQGIGNGVKVRFEDKDCSGIYRMTTDPDPH